MIVSLQRFARGVGGGGRGESWEGEWDQFFYEVNEEVNAPGARTWEHTVVR